MAETATPAPWKGGTFKSGALRLEHLAPSGKIALRGRADDPAFAAGTGRVLGATLPTRPNSFVEVEDMAVMWRGPDEWLVDMPLTATDGAVERLGSVLTACHASVVEISDAWFTFRLSGKGAREVLASGCPLALHERAFRPWQCAQSHYLHVGIILRLLDTTPAFDIYVRRSEAEHLWTMLWMACEVEAADAELERDGGEPPAASATRGGK